MMTCYGVSHIQFTKRRFRYKEIKKLIQNYKHSVLKTQTQKSVTCSQMKKAQRGEGWWRDESGPNVLYPCMVFSKSKLMKRKSKASSFSQRIRDLISLVLRKDSNGLKNQGLLPRKGTIFVGQCSFKFKWGQT